MSGSPRISCVLAVWNGEAHLAGALRSILGQTFQDFELIIVDDGSTDGTVEILRRFQREDRRIRLHDQPHAGLVAALNFGISLATGEYIARMDADDLCAPERFEKQVQYLDTHPVVGICGTWIETFGQGSNEVIRYPSDDGAIRCQLLFSSALAHPSTMLRRSVLMRHGLQYDERAVNAEDYDLWVRASEHTRFANVPAVLLRYRVHPQQVGRRCAEKMEVSSQDIRLTQLARLGVSPTPEERQLHQDLSRWRFESSAAFLRSTREWLGKLVAANASARLYGDAELLAVLGQRWSEVCLLATQEGVQTLIAFWCAPRLALSVLSLWQHTKFVMKCLFRKDPHTQFVRMSRATDSIGPH